MKKRSFGLVKMLLVWPKVAIIISTALNYKKIAQFSNWNYPILTASNIPNKAIRSWISEFYLIVKFIAQRLEFISEPLVSWHRINVLVCFLDFLDFNALYTAFILSFVRMLENLNKSDMELDKVMIGANGD